jgi:GT2 family glycosyltransferase
MYKVGIVMLSYNRADVVVPCLDSLVNTVNQHAEIELFLLDNASNKDDYELIKACFDEYLSKGKLSGELVRLEYNSGYPAGNNFGIKKFLANHNITHICLLNSDVIVTDYWLDRLLDNDVDAVGPITNACGNEQTIPIPFKADLNKLNVQEINKFAQDRFKLYNGLRVESNFLGFFCFLGSKKLFSEVGLLDEQFGRGAYEDDDFCLRMLSAGYKLFIDRSVFLYHFGSASFSRVSHAQLMSHLSHNVQLFEAKHNMKWQPRDMLPYTGFLQDIEYLIKQQSDNLLLANEFKLYHENSKLLLESLFVERRTLGLEHIGIRQLWSALLKRLKKKLLG